MTASLHDRFALVTGSTDGIGSAIAKALAAEGAHVIVSGRDVTKGEKVVAAIAEAGGQATFVAADLADGAGVTKLADAAHALAGGPLDILVNNAAMLLTPTPTTDVAEDLIDAALATNVKSVFLLTGQVAPRMAERGRGAIVNIGSIAALAGTANSALYGVTKAAIHFLTKSWAAEYGPAGVRVNTVAPGPTLTERIAASEVTRTHIAPMLASIPSRRASTPEEIAKAVVFFAGDDTPNVHGATLMIDGGAAAV